MNFKEATDLLCEGLGHEDVAKMLNVSVQTVRQARLSPTAKAYRRPPDGWEAAVKRLSEARIADLQTLTERLTRNRT